ncbi:FUSC family protein [Tannockella kyphosi]|uniref:FUSC family protein n=1 Tax=Tannockella kyphosi TaxID=2899121 RepID=UPI002010F8EE|nr:aromatic acid exporter family protein [Tannockella kyphosi]
MKKIKIPGFGQRGFKTALTTMLCAFLYALIGRNPTFACIGVIFGMGSNLKDSILNGGNRLIGTIIGGFLGIGLFTIYIYVFHASNEFLLLPLLGIGTLLLVSLSLIFKWPGAVQPGGVVLCIILYNTASELYVTYSLNRMFDTGVGVVLAIVINVIFSRTAVNQFLHRIGLINLDEYSFDESEIKSNV